MMVDRLRTVAAALVLLAGGPACAGTASAPVLASDTAVASDAHAVTMTLLGTGGGPGGRVDRSGIATLVQIGDRNYLVDAGDGVSRQLAHAGIGDVEIPVVFLTHLHDDHYAGLTALATFAYTLRSRNLHLVGPAGTDQLRTALAAMLQVSANIRMVENRLPLTPDQFLHATQFTQNPVYQDDRVTVTAIENHHFRFGPESPAATNKSYSLRFETGGRVIVFTGDTGPDPRVDELARGADIMFAEMVSAADRLAVPPQVLRHMDEEHLSPTEVGLLATRAGVRKLVLTHIGDVSEEDIAEVRRNYSGELVVGTDLAEIAL
ncbi:MBL fold metallo-hydrolase [Alteraurantiacibacter buctensis]|uniref:MBL fold metallo-hydrolase n=1 Tax=Alteraurantiacibacter buctensis TaxID=1503981 RepID=A0A844Z3Z8_9SPHN|nr:MBL fold metallo-hydrolase [Alteraurantiacibacter buctensis]MXO73317.1 MBL fold metallo-hydrolase [Alteraurantiacibacter buctensis]